MYINNANIGNVWYDKEECYSKYSQVFHGVLVGAWVNRFICLNTEEVIARNKIKDIPFFYLRGGCFPLKELKGMDKFILSMFLMMLKSRKDKDEKLEEAIAIIENSFDGVKEENLELVVGWLSTR